MGYTRPLGTQVKLETRFSRNVFSKWDLYLKKLLSDSIETFLFWRIYFWLGGRAEKNYKKMKIYNFVKALKGRKI